VTGLSDAGSTPAASITYSGDFVPGPLTRLLARLASREKHTASLGSFARRSALRSSAASGTSSPEPLTHSLARLASREKHTSKPRLVSRGALSFARALRQGLRPRLARHSLGEGGTPHSLTRVAHSLTARSLTPVTIASLRSLALPKMAYSPTRESAPVLPRRARGDEHQVIVWIDMVHVVRRDELVFRKDRRRHRSVVQYVERDTENRGSVLFGKVRH